MSKSDLISKICQKNPVFWQNEQQINSPEALAKLDFDRSDMEEARQLWQRFAPLLSELFSEVAKREGLIESDLISIPAMQAALEEHYQTEIAGDLFLKGDHALPVAGSIKARGGIYEVLKHAEELALESGKLSVDDDYSILATDKWQRFFNHYTLEVGSTGNLGLSIGIMGSALGFEVIVHMSSDATEWKKELLRSRGVKVIEYQDDYTTAVEEGRQAAEEKPSSYFIDDENSKDLFLGYSVAAYRLQEQLADAGVEVSQDQPLVVYLPCGVGGAPGGITFGLKELFGDQVECYFVEPTKAPCMLLGLLTEEYGEINTQDFGITEQTAADGLAVAAPSPLVSKVVRELITGSYTIADQELYKLLALLQDSEGIEVEPSAAAGLLGPTLVNQEATHIVWATGGLFVPEEERLKFYQRGQELLTT